MESGRIDETQLLEWVGKARELATNADRADIADYQIGRLLARAAADEDESWPQLSVRNLIERLASEALERGVVNGVYNNRGMVSRAIGEGGLQERELAKRYRSYALACVDEWPRTARLLNGVADHYERKARNEDVEAEIEDDRWS